MIGLFFFGSIALWGVIAIALGLKLPKWLGVQRHRTLWGGVFTVLVFFAPVTDEIIAYPQLKAMCRGVGDFEFDQQTATGRAVSKYPTIISRDTKSLFPNIQIRVQHGALVTPVTEIPVVKWVWIEPRAGFLNFPAGSSGDSMPLLLSDCGSTPRPRIGKESLQEVIARLKLIETDYQPTKYK
ncbi:hypothetical protein RQP54_17460 [Curvibacter sp. APW13]|uniref:hypothetical protein n=1 Tax=Curvibacter sp. APW13 TaxID=3077236 RepID=UPI0028E07A20|nr:hypothetical protein [Curvibacter sp. APW13]MDT8992663.1 hypothetical protein [Curvibacter sp. APW13]